MTQYLVEYGGYGMKPKTIEVFCSRECLAKAGIDISDFSYLIASDMPCEVCGVTDPFGHPIEWDGGQYIEVEDEDDES